MLFKRKSVEMPEVRPLSVPAPGETDRALDAVAALVRGFGAFAFDTDRHQAVELREECDKWAGQILLGGDGEERQVDSPRRDWGGLRRFFDERRRGESDYVRASQSSFRSALHAFARCVRATVVDDRAAEQVVGLELVAMGDALATNDIDRIRTAAVNLVGVVSATTESRRRRHEAELATLSEQLRSLRGELTSVREKASLDPLTQLYNRAALDEHVSRIAELGLVLGTPPTIMMVDVDHFKVINDTHGHPVGDIVLKRVAETLLRNFLRKEDFVARYGGEEFSVVLLEVKREDAFGLAERLCKAVRGLRIERGDTVLGVTVSAGVTSLVPGEEAATWVERADRALYRAKAEGRDRVVVAELPATFA